MGKTLKRRKYFIKKEYQGKLILSCFLFVAGIGLLFNVILGMLSADSLTISYSNQELQLGQTPMMLFKQLLTANWLILIIGGGFVIFAALYLSHRVVGPLYRFEATLDSMQKGKLDTVIKLRDKDEGKELAQKINDFNSLLSRSMNDISQHSQALNILIEQASKLNLQNDEEKEQFASLCWSMQEHNRKVSTCCNYFTTQG